MKSFFIPFAFLGCLAIEKGMSSYLLVEVEEDGGIPKFQDHSQGFPVVRDPVVDSNGRPEARGFPNCFKPGSEIPEPKKMNNGFPCWNEHDGKKCKNICKSKICSPCGCGKPGCPNHERCGKPVGSACNKNKDCCSLICENKKCAYNPKHPILPPKKGTVGNSRSLAYCTKEGSSCLGGIECCPGLCCEGFPMFGGRKCTQDCSSEEKK